MGAKCCVCIKDSKKPSENLPSKFISKSNNSEKDPLDLNSINPVLKEAYNHTSSLQVEQYKQSLREAITKGSTLEITNIITKGFPINEAISHDKFTALHLACKHGNLSIVQHIIEKIEGVNIDIQDENEKWTPLMLASMNGHIEIVKYLLVKKADKSLVSDENKDAGAYAKQGDFLEIMEILKK